MSARHRIPRTALLLTVLAVCAVLTATAGCSSATDVEVLLEDLDRAEELWLQTRPIEYEAEASRICECLSHETGPLLLEISMVEAMLSSMSRDVMEEIVGGVYLGGELHGEPVPDEVLALFLTAEEMFDLVRRAADEDAHSISVVYDPDRGYLRRVDIDWDERVADEETHLRFEVLDAGT